MLDWFWGLLVRAVISWFDRHPGLIGGFIVGFGAGVIFCLPLVPWTIPDGTANVLGAALGAVLAVWGATWVANRRDRERVRNLRSALESIASSAWLAVDQFADAVRSAVSSGEREDVLAAFRACRPVELEAQAFSRRLTRLTPQLEQLGGSGILASESLDRSAQVLATVTSPFNGDWYESASERVGGSTEIAMQVALARMHFQAALSALR